MARTLHFVISVSHTPKGFALWMKGCRLAAVLFT
jgi:hypothetical protein